MSTPIDNKLHPAVNFLNEKDIFKTYNTKNYPFADILEELFNIDSIDLLHKKISSEEDFNADLGKDSESFYHKLFYNEIKDNNIQCKIIIKLFFITLSLKPFLLSSLILFTTQSILFR